MAKFEKRFNKIVKLVKECCLYKRADLYKVHYLAEKCLKKMSSSDLDNTEFLDDVHTLTNRIAVVRMEQDAKKLIAELKAVVSKREGEVNVDVANTKRKPIDRPGRDRSGKRRSYPSKKPVKTETSARVRRSYPPKFVVC